MEQVRNILSPANGVKPDELKWTGLDDYIKSKAYFTKEEVLAFVRANQVEIREVMKGEGRMSEEAKADIPRLTKIVNDGGYSVEENPEDPGIIAFMYQGTEEGEKSEWAGELIQADAIEDLTVRNAAYALERLYAGETSDAKFSQYTLPGGTNYRELLLTLPDVRPSGRNGQFVVVNSQGAVLTKPYATREDAERVLNSDTNARDFHGLRVEQVETKEAAFELPKFQSSHFSEPNIISHVRFNDRMVNGRKVLFLEEIQSDFGQKIRREQDAVKAAVKADFHGIILRMKTDGVITLECD